ncbi:TIGR03943 family putative permease subunit [Amycolatopsis plumensis]|uniref:TIGR03943 family putative permease subunit n=1 Tax=Amycolatopsis plumensis TaxID=236508 RepID=A0ABV5UJ02_9PSEU
MRREAQNILLLLVGGALLKITFDGTYLRYVKPGMAPWLIGAGAVAVVLAAVAIVTDIRGRGATTDHDHRTRSTWLLLLPVLAIFLVAPPALGADAVNRSGPRTVAGPVADGTAKVPFAPLPPGDPVRLKLDEVVTRAGWDSAGTLDGRVVELTGFVVHSASRKPYLTRIVMGCCAADTFPVHALLAGDRLPAWRDDQWLTVTGTVVPNTATKANGYTPALRIRSVREVPAPPDVYEY